jgi:hypothetical protein
MENNNRQGCRWTKASEQKPESDGAYVVKIHGKKFITTFDKGIGFGISGPLEWLDESIEPCATSSENYWKQRCEAAERFINESPCDPDITKAQIYAHEVWQKLKNKKP